MFVLGFVKELRAEVFVVCVGVTKFVICGEMYVWGDADCNVWGVVKCVKFRVFLVKK